MPEVPNAHFPNTRSLIKPPPCPFMQILVATCIWIVTLQKAWISGSPLSCPFQGNFCHERVKLQLLRLSDEMVRPHCPVPHPSSLGILSSCSSLRHIQVLSRQDGSILLNIPVSPSAYIFLCTPEYYPFSWLDIQSSTKIFISCHQKVWEFKN